MTARIPAWVCAPGVRRVPFLKTFLPEYDLRAAPGPGIGAVIGWGLKRTAAMGRAWAETRGLPYVALEDGFLRSIGLGETGAASLSLIADDLGVYYDARRPSRAGRQGGSAARAHGPAGKPTPRHRNEAAPRSRPCSRSARPVRKRGSR